MHSARSWFVDLIVNNVEPGLVQLIPNSIHAVFWLQTHFPKEEWDTLLSCQAAFEDSCMSTLAEDARNAGLQVDWECQVPS